MAPSTITLRVPADAPFRGLAAAAVSRFAEVCGVGAAESAALGASVERAATDVAVGADHLDIVCAHDGAGLEISLSGGAHRRVVRHPHS